LFNKNKSKQQDKDRSKRGANEEDGDNNSNGVTTVKSDSIDRPATYSNNNNGFVRTQPKKKNLDHLPPHVRREILKEQRREAKQADLAMKSPMYDNVKMLDPEGELLSKISKRKGEWYVRKNLAEWTDSSEKCIKILFQPKAKSNPSVGKGLFDRSDKINQCVNCGDTKYHIRHNVVPSVYRTLFPLKFKSHLSHDVVILCPKCNVHCSRQTQYRMQEIEDSHRPPGSKPQYETDHVLYHMRSCALALLRFKEQLPENKRTEYEAMVRRHLKIDESSDVDLTPDQLQEAIDVEYRIENPDWVPGAVLVVEALNGDEEKIERFVRDWRRHFLQTMGPRFLTKGWGVDTPVMSGLS